jgi:hypothetical protein
VSRTQFANALVRGASTVTPVVSWQLIQPDHAGLAPTLDHPGVTSVAIAATWPPEVQPVAVRLVSFGAMGMGPGSSAPPKARPPARVDIPLGDSLVRTLRVVPSRPSGAGPSVGAFYFPMPRSPVAMTGWPGHGWPPATYAFEVELDGGRQITLPFTIGAAIGSG